MDGLSVRVTSLSVWIVFDSGTNTFRIRTTDGNDTTAYAEGVPIGVLYDALKKLADTRSKKKRKAAHA